MRKKSKRLCKLVQIRAPAPREAELQKSHGEGRELRNRLVVPKAELAARSECAVCKEQREQLVNRAAAAESAAAEMWQELRQLQEEHIKCHEHSKELVTRLEAEAVEHASSKDRLSQVESDAERLQEESRSFQERCQLAEVRLTEAASQTELQLEKAVLLLGQLLELHEEKGMHKEPIRELERQLCEAKQCEAHHAGGPSPPWRGTQSNDLQQPVSCRAAGVQLHGR